MGPRTHEAAIDKSAQIREARAHADHAVALLDRVRLGTAASPEQSLGHAEQLLERALDGVRAAYAMPLAA